MTLQELLALALLNPALKERLKTNFIATARELGVSLSKDQVTAFGKMTAQDWDTVESSTTSEVLSSPCAL